MSSGRASRRGPLSPSQQGLWLLERLGASGAYHNLLSLFLRGPLNRAALESALQEVISRHEALRTRFTADGDSVEQEVMPQAVAALEDLSVPGGQPHLLSATEALSRAGTWCRLPFTLDAAPLMRASLTPVDDMSHLLVIAAHHLVSDGDSMMIVLRELLTAYDARICGLPDPLPPAPAQFLDIVGAPASGHRSLDQGLAFWRDYLSGAPQVLDLPLDRPRPARPTYRGAVRQWRFQPSTVAAVRELARTQRVTLFMTALAMTGVLLTRLGGTSEVVIGIPMSLRRDARSRQAVGYLVNTIVVRLEVTPDATVAELLASVRRATLQAYDRSHVPFEAVVRDLRPPRRIDHNPLFQVILAFTDRGDEAARQYAKQIAGLELDFPDVEPGVARADLSFCIHEVAGTLAVDVEHAADLCDTATAGSLAAALESLLAAAAANPQQRAATLPLSRMGGPGTRPALPRASLAHRQQPGPDALGALLEKAITGASQSPGREVLACPDCTMTAGALQLASRPPARPERGQAEAGRPVILGTGTITSCRDAAEALRILRAVPPSPDERPGGSASRFREARAAIAGPGYAASRASLAAAIGWLASAQSPLCPGQRMVLVKSAATPAGFAIMLAHLLTGGEVVFAGEEWAGMLTGDGSELLVGTTADLIAGWEHITATRLPLAGVLVTGEPPLVKPWERRARDARNCPVSYVGGPAAAAGVVFSGDVTGSQGTGRVLGRAVGTAEISIDDHDGVAVPSAFPGDLRCHLPGGGPPVTVCRARVTGSGAMEMTGPLAPAGIPAAPPLCQLEGVIGSLPQVADVEASWQRHPSGRRYLAAEVVAQPPARLGAGAVADELRHHLAPHLLPAQLRVRPRLMPGPHGWLARGHDDERSLGALLADALRT